jgi:hypothetical protein
MSSLARNSLSGSSSLRNLDDVLNFVRKRPLQANSVAVEIMAPEIRRRLNALQASSLDLAKAKELARLFAAWTDESFSPTYVFTPSVHAGKEL